jgi:hypothetical protein
MKIKTSEAARSLAVHPAHLFLHTAEIASSLKFDDVWPEIEKDWIDTIAVVAGGHHREGSVQAPPAAKAKPPSPTLVLSENAMHVADKLRRQSKWGVAAVPFDALVKLTHLSSHQVQEAVAELRKNGLLDSEHDGTGGRRIISLSSARRKEIESIAQP